jgi:hypothetical protein
MMPRRNLPLFLLMLGLSFACQSAGRGEPSSEGLPFTLINTVPNSTGFKCYIRTSKETNVLTPVGEAAADAAGNGFSTGVIRWTPADGDLVAEVPNREPASLRPFIKPGESPLVILRAKGANGVDFSLLPKPVSRESAFYDAVNITAQAQLEVSVDGRKVSLPRGQRVRLSKKNSMEYKVSGGPGDLVESIDPPSHVLVFYGDDAGNVRCLVVADRSP